MVRVFQRRYSTSVQPGNSDYPFWSVQLNAVPTKEADISLTRQTLDYIYKQSGINTLGDVHKALYKGVTADKPIAAIPFYESFPQFYPKEDIENPDQRRFNFLHHNEDLDRYHIITHIATDSAFTFSGEARVRAAEMVMYGCFVSSLDQTNFYKQESKFGLGRDLKKIVNEMDRLANRTIEAHENRMDLGKYDFQISYKLDKSNNVDLANSPELLSVITQAAYINENFAVVKGKYIGELKSEELRQMPKELFRLTDSQRQEVQDIVAFNTNPSSGITLHNFSEVGRNVQNYIQTLS